MRKTSFFILQQLIKPKVTSFMSTFFIDLDKTESNTEHLFIICQFIYHVTMPAYEFRSVQ